MQDPLCNMDTRAAAAPCDIQVDGSWHLNKNSQKVASGFFAIDMDSALNLKHLTLLWALLLLNLNK